MARTQDEILTALDGELPALREMVVLAHQRYLEVPLTSRIALGATAQATMTHDYWVDEASKFAQGRPASELMDSGGLKFLALANARVAVRCKKLDRNCLPAGTPTKQFVAYRSQQQLDGLPGFDLLELGYQLSVTNEISGVFLLKPSGQKANEWVAELGVTGSSSVVVDMFQGGDVDLPGGTVTTKKGDGGRDGDQAGDADSGA